MKEDWLLELMRWKAESLGERANKQQLTRNEALERISSWIGNKDGEIKGEKIRYFFGKWIYTYVYFCMLFSILLHKTKG